MAKEKVKVSNVTGLTKTQERACMLLASGESVSSVAELLKVPEENLFLWQKQNTFICYYNKRRSVLRDQAIQGLFSLVDEAISTIRDSLNSTNENVRLRTATYIVDKLQSLELGETDILDSVREESTFSDDWLNGEKFHETYYSDKLKELGIKEQNYQETLK